MKPGWVRINFNYFISDTVFSYLLEAVSLIAEHGWRLLPAYEFNPTSGLWRHRDLRRSRIASLHDITYESGRMEYATRHATEPEASIKKHLCDAREILERGAAPELCTVANRPSLTEDFESLRWFPLPHEAAGRLSEPRA